MKENKEEKNIAEEIKKHGITHDMLFCFTLSQEIAAEKLVSALFSQRFVGVKEIHVQKPSKEHFSAKETRFDVLVEDKNGRLFDLEMQNSNIDNLFKRADVYASKLTLQSVNELEEWKRKSGEHYQYEQIPERYVIFFCKFDIKKEGFPIYCNDKGYCSLKECKASSGNHQIFINVLDYDKIKDNELKNLARFMVTGEAQGDLCQVIRESMKKLEKQQEWRDYFMTLEMILEDRVAQGVAQGVAKTIRKLAKSMTKEEISEHLEISVEEVESLLEENES